MKKLMLLTLTAALVSGLSLYAEDAGKTRTLTGEIVKVDLEGKTIVVKVSGVPAGSDAKNVTFILSEQTKIKQAPEMNNEKWIDRKMADLKEGMRVEVACQPWKGETQFEALEIKILN